jgi:hypothetical protein
VVVKRNGSLTHPATLPPLAEMGATSILKMRKDNYSKKNSKTFLAESFFIFVT